jgi:hypothetical protein
MAQRFQGRAISRAGLVVAAAIDVVAQHEEMGALLCYRLQLPVGSTYAAGAAVVMATLADQTSLPWPDEFPRKTRRAGDAEAPSP